MRAKVEVHIDPPATGRAGFRLPSGSGSLLYRFKDGEPEEVIAGATFEIGEGLEIVQGEDYEGVLNFWTEGIAQLVQPGEPFVVWYGGDVGRGVVIGPSQGWSHEPYN